MTKNKDAILRSFWNHLEGINDVIGSNLISAVSSGHLKISQESIVQLMSIIKYSSEEGFHRCQNTFSRELDTMLKEEVTAETSSKSKSVSKKN